MNLLLVDGSNLVMRASLGGALSPAMAVVNATSLVRKSIAATQATHLIIALDLARSLGAFPTWRKVRYPEYKANRTTDTSPYLIAAQTEWEKMDWWVESVPSFEADDVIATIAMRVKDRALVTVCSGDSDLIPLMAHAPKPSLADSLTQNSLTGIQILRPENGGIFTALTSADVCKKYQVARPELVRDRKALAGDDGDNVPGVPGIGDIRASRLLAEHGDIAGVIAAAKSPGANKDLFRVAQHRATVELALELVTLREDAPVQPIHPKACECGARTAESASS